mmetsp:Transcript_12827/g.19229  ORF Transcript_12827/g.19229 Transcript_12827/m.19229 type:complete len:371 (+) Transcript_12827:140-1252(+)
MKAMTFYFNPQRKPCNLSLLVVMAAILTAFVHGDAQSCPSSSSSSQSNSTGSAESESGSTSTSTSKAIKTMKLYSNIERIDRQLAHLGYSPDQDLSQETLSPIDSMHYLGDDAIEAAIGLLLPTVDAKVLDVGSGFGGPARYMASRGCNVVALELQPDVSAKGKELTQRCNFSDQVTHITGDILKDVSNENVEDSESDSRSAPLWTEREQYDMVTSWLVFLHITEKNKLYQTSYDLIKSGGHIYIEDFYRRTAPEGENVNNNVNACGFTEEESTILSRDIYCEGSSLHTREEYIQALEEVGFVNVTFVDMTGSWSAYVKARYEDFLEKKDSFVEIHGMDGFESLSHFFNAMNTLFHGNNLGGVRIHGTKK